MSIKEVRVDKVPWTPILLLTIAIGILNPLVTSMQPRSVAFWYNIGITGCMLYLMPLPFFLILVLVLLTRMGIIKRISPSTFTYLYACTTALAFPGVADEVFLPVTYWVDRYMSPLSMELEPWFFAPRPDIAQQIVAGGMPIPFVEWLPSILWWWMLLSLWALFMIGLATVLRRQWVDVEKVPFPQTLMANELVKMASKEEASSGFRNRKPLSFGILIGMAFGAILFMILTFPWFPDVFGWRTNTCGFGGTYVTAASPLASIMGFIMIEKNPLFVAALYLAPLVLLFNAWFWSIVVIVLIQIAYAIGFYTELPTLDGCGRAWCGAQSLWYGQPFTLLAFGDIGLALGIFVSYFFINKGYIAGTVRAALRRGNTLETEKGEAVSYRTTYVILLVSFLAIIISFMAASISLLPSLIIFLVTVLYVGFMQGRFYGLYGYMVPGGMFASPGFLKIVWPHAPEPRTMEWTVAMGFVNQPAANAAYVGWGHPFLALSSSYTLAGYTGTNPRNVLKVTSIVAVLTPILALLTLLWASYAFGLNRMPGRSFAWSIIDRYSPEQIEKMPARDIWWPQALAGFIIAFALNYLHARFIWFPLEPMGLLIAVDHWTILMALWQSALIAWVIKILTMRVGGSKIYEEMGKPLASGFIIGFAVTTIIGAAIGVVRFFMPF